MATFTDRNLVKQVISNGGFPSEDRAQSVYEYEAGSGRVMWAVFWGSATGMLNQYNVCNPRQLWNKKVGITSAGEEFLADDS